MYNFVRQQNSRAIEERLLCLKESLHNASSKGNTMQEVVSKKIQNFIPEPTASQRIEALKLKKHIKSKRQVEKPPASNPRKHPLCTNMLESQIPKSLEKPHMLNKYDWKWDSNEHVQLVDDCLNYIHAYDSFKCKLFVLTLMGSARLWFKALPNGSIEAWTNIFESFTIYYRPEKETSDNRYLKRDNTWKEGELTIIRWVVQVSACGSRKSWRGS